MGSSNERHCGSQNSLATSSISAPVIQIYTHVTNAQLSNVEAVKDFSLVIGMTLSDALARFERTSAEFLF